MIKEVAFTKKSQCRSLCGPANVFPGITYRKQFGGIVKIFVNLCPDFLRFCLGGEKIFRFFIGFEIRGILLKKVTK